MSTTEEQAAEAVTSGPPIVLAPEPRTTDPRPALAQRRLRAPLRHRLGLLRRGQQPAHAPGPIADSFSAGPSDLSLTWELLEHGPFPLLSEIRRRGRDVVLVG
ncbi:hypothetical protein PV371_37225 [Streptomyces sp. TX20-6-3]|uniref:hypothetical protein n=1 Tax=Streptomyces sp. TX20-6-3 TaxID=3028705 RepID=UPI0029B1D3F7|nr:hypothetical protein [Streptomyces sp. TX20-6-3]MDX2565249.1 hypothetical protein [Streptomyces sp. TX20-6-3]